MNLMLIGLGLHAMRVQYSLLCKHRFDWNVHIACVVDLESKQEVITDYLARKQVSPDELIFLSSEEITYDELLPSIQEKLNRVIAQYNIEGVIIATEPLSHMVYARWALRKGLSILMDKPISTRNNVSNSLVEINSLCEDYFELVHLYQQAQQMNVYCTFIVMTHRRFHKGFMKVRELIEEVFEQTNCPVTSITSEDSDGEWRMPEEILHQTYHPYNQGYGMISHSGYHYVDLLSWLLASTQGRGKNIDNADIFTTFVKPADFIEQITVDNIQHLFPHKYSEEEAEQLKVSFSETTKRFGELDGFSTILFKTNDKIMTVANLHLAHNSFSQRGWASSVGRNLYTGNGRVRQESHHIQQGPFQSIRFHTFRSGGVEQNDQSAGIGGGRHLDIHVFRNSALFPQWKTVETFTMKDVLVLDTHESQPDQENAKKDCVFHFIQAMRGEVKRESFISDLLSHRTGVLLLAGIYRAAISHEQKEYPIINIPLTEGF